MNVVIKTALTIVDFRSEGFDRSDSQTVNICKHLNYSCHKVCKKKTAIDYTAVNRTAATVVCIANLNWVTKSF